DAARPARTHRASGWQGRAAAEGAQVITAEHRAAVAAEIPKGVAVPRDFWRDLQTAIDMYCVMDERRTSKPPRQRLERFQRIEKLTDAIAAELREIRLRISPDGFNPFWPNRVLRALWESKWQAERHIIGNAALAEGYGGHSAPHRELFYRAILD